jgi:methionine synthase II (cobalamin-independent)
MTENKITKDMSMEELVESFPATIKPLQEMGVQCIVCGEPVWGTLEDSILRKGLHNMDEIISILNKAAAEGYTDEVKERIQGVIDANFR